MPRKGLFIALAAGIAFAPGVALAQQACTEITYTGHPDYAPISFRDGDAIAGAGARVIEEAAAALGVEAHSVYMGSWAATQEAVREGRADIIFSLYVTDDRQTYLDFVEPPFALNPEVALVPVGADFAFSGPDDLIGKQGVTVAGESFGAAFDAYLAENLTFDRVEALSDAIHEVLAGEADYMIFGLYPALAEAAELEVADEIEALSPPLVEGDLYIAFSKQSACLDLLEPFAAEIQTLLDSGRVDELIAEAEAEFAEITH